MSEPTVSVSPPPPPPPVVLSSLLPQPVANTATARIVRAASKVDTRDLLFKIASDGE
jgi:hypothetical protein